MWDTCPGVLLSLGFIVQRGECPEGKWLGFLSESFVLGSLIKQQQVVSQYGQSLTQQNQCWYEKVNSVTGQISHLKKIRFVAKCQNTEETFKGAQMLNIYRTEHICWQYPTTDAPAIRIFCHHPDRFKSQCSCLFWVFSFCSSRSIGCAGSQADFFVSYHNIILTTLVITIPSIAFCTGASH